MNVSSNPEQFKASRRAVMAGLASVSVTVTAGSAASAYPVISPLRALYHEWQQAKQVFARRDLEDGSPEERALFDAVYRMEARAAAYEPETVEDLWFKILFADDDGDMSVNIDQEALVAMAHKMTAVPAGA